MAASKSKRKELTLGEKIELIKASNELSLSQRDLVTKFGISLRRQVRMEMNQKMNLQKQKL